MTVHNLLLLICLNDHMKLVIQRKILQVKVGARVMITTNIDVSDGLTNGAMGFVSNIVMDTLSRHKSYIGGFW